MSRKRAKISILVDGRPIKEIPLTESNADWMKAKRLNEKGTAEAERKLEKMENTGMKVVSKEELFG